MKEETNFFYRREIQTWINVLVPLACLLAAVAEYFVHRHPHFSFESIINFHGFYGFVSYCFIVLFAKALRPILHRKEDYYD